MQQPQLPTFGVIGGAAVSAALTDREPEIIALVRETYLAHHRGRSSNPPSAFLRFEDRANARIIALPASLHTEPRVDGIKWIASYPSNHDLGLPRASSVTILNDPGTGMPYACLQSSQLSAARTAASAALAWQVLGRDRPAPETIGIVGTGPIARATLQYLSAAGLRPERIGLFDLDPARARSFETEIERTVPGVRTVVHPTIERVVRQHPVLIFATTAPTPHVSEVTWFDHHPLVLHLSLRDLAPEVVLAAYNVVDDREHAVSAQTSLHLAGERVGHADFVAGTLAEVVQTEMATPPDQTVVFAPFGMGILDLALARLVYDVTSVTGRVTRVPDFFDPVGPLAAVG